MAAAPAGETKKIQIYSSSSSSSARKVTPFWKEKYEKDAKKYWDLFYKRHRDKFFKDRHYFDKEWGRHFKAGEGEKLVVLEVGCGAGNSIFPLLSTYQGIFIHACDFSPRAIDLVKAHKDFSCDQINAFVCDITLHNLNDTIPSSSVDIVTMVFVLSAVAPEKMTLVLQNIRKVLKPNGRVLFRDYATGDLAQERLTCKEQQISENFYVRGDGTRAYYFTEDFLTSLFTENGFHALEVGVCNKQVENRSLELVMNRRWIQAVYSASLPNYSDLSTKLEEVTDDHGTSKISTEDSRIHDQIDISDSIAQMFDVLPSNDVVVEIKLRGYVFRIKGLSKEYQHTCKSTGLILWESAHLMSNLLAENPSIVAGKRVLELGCGSAGICSMVSVPFAELLVATDGDTAALDLLNQNVASNLEPSLSEKMVIKRLIWGDKEDMAVIKDLGGFDVIIGTDVTYYPEAILPLFKTARELILNRDDGEKKSVLILCYIQRRADEGSIMSAASHFGFKLVDRWANGTSLDDGIISSWFSSGAACATEFKNTPLIILYFEA
ncbi:uncharacterized protein M6B38_157505 [Iris pallida]|uniref:Methyltransferase type 12 domain-containing protein n=1 Tax=Iris pallida TaxID=29817 RepID=A0AAX6F1N0_IRIPA|nr:uncharacterized protein M6B38_157505 [Iris pallida]